MRFVERGARVGRVVGWHRDASRVATARGHGTMCGMRALVTLIATCVLTCAGVAAHAQQAGHERTIYRCVRAGTVSLSTAPEPGSRCEKRRIQDTAGKPANLWGELGSFTGTLYEREQDGVLVHGTRKLPGSRVVTRFTVQTAKASPAHEGLGKVAPPRLDRYPKEFQAAARRHKVDDAYLRAIAHAESGFDAQAVSPKGAQGVMQLMPAVQAELGVLDAFAPAQAIDAAARHLKALLARYKGDYVLAAAAYNAGIGAVGKYGGVPPYRETRDYVDKVRALHIAYRKALKLPPLVPEPLRPAT